MRLASFVLVLVSVIGCAHTGKSADFTFHDAHGNIYSASSTPTKLQKEFDLSSKPKIVVIAASSISNIKYKEQISEISKLNAEELQFLYVLANSEEEDNSGYYSTLTASSKILDGKEFKILIYGGQGEIIKSSDTVIKAEELKNHLTFNK
jgi:hypothetical protein